MTGSKLINVKVLEKYITECFIKCGVSEEDAIITADVLIESDKRGIASHGVARLHRYIDGLKKGIMIPDAQFEIVKETANTLLVSGNDGLGQPVSFKATKKLIEKAKTNNIAFATIRNSNHYGVAGYYSSMIQKEDMIGFSMTNSFPLVVPTHGKNALLGTNPIAVAAPSGEEIPFALDMATSTVPRGKLEVYDRQNKTMPKAWATGTDGNPETDAGVVLSNLVSKLGGGLLPLGGASQEFGGHKGYGMGLVVEILTGILSGGAFGPNVYGTPGKPANVCHFIGAININAFLPIDVFKKSMDSMITTLHNSEKAEGHDRIFIHGEKEHNLKIKQEKEVSITNTVLNNITEVGKSLGVKADF